MKDLKQYKGELEENGYSILGSIFTIAEIEKILDCIKNININEHSTTKTDDLFAVRKLLMNNSKLEKLIFNKKMVEILSSLFKTKYFLTKAIYFDKPIKSNWFVAYHQDISISVNKKIKLEGYNYWTFKQGIYGVQPPVNILNDTVTIRIHLDDTTNKNGALNIIPKSHLNGIVRKNSQDFSITNEKSCQIEKGGIMLMKPLLFHSSKKSTNNKKRRVIHLEFNKNMLPEPLKWIEYLPINNSLNT